MFYRYKVNYYDEYKDEEVEDEGLVWANNYGAAANNVVDDYGKTTIVDLFLKEIYIEGNTCMDKDELDSAFND